jgi:hypothetical protein
MDAGKGIPQYGANAMNFMIRIAMCIAVLAAFVFAPPVRAVDRTFVAVASYLDRPEVIEKEGKRTAAILSEHKITHRLGDRIFDETAWAKWIARHGAESAVIFVPKDESAEARLVLARLIKKEGLKITLRSDDGGTVTLESVLEPNKKP